MHLPNLASRSRLVTLCAAGVLFGPFGLVATAAHAAPVRPGSVAVPGVADAVNVPRTDVAVRFVPRSYHTGSTPIGVTVRADMLVVQASPALSADALALLAEDAALKLDANGSISVASARRVRPDGLFKLTFAHDVAQPLLVKLAQALAAAVPVTDVYPALARVSGYAFTDDKLIVSATNFNAGISSLLNMSYWRFTSARTWLDTSLKLLNVTKPFLTPARIASSCAPMRTSKNSSKLEATIHKYLSRSSKG